MAFKKIARSVSYTPKIQPLSDSEVLWDMIDFVLVDEKNAINGRMQYYFCIQGQKVSVPAAYLNTSDALEKACTAKGIKIPRLDTRDWIKILDSLSTSGKLSYCREGLV